MLTIADWSRIFRLQNMRARAMAGTHSIHVRALVRHSEAGNCTDMFAATPENYQNGFHIHIRPVFFFGFSTETSEVEKETRRNEENEIAKPSCTVQSPSARHISEPRRNKQFGRGRSHVPSCKAGHLMRLMIIGRLHTFTEVS